MSKSLWAVSQGSYSDYRVLWVFERKEDAEAAVADRNLGGDEVEEMPCFGTGEQPAKVMKYSARGVLGTMEVQVFYERLVSEGGYEWPVPKRPRVQEYTFYNHGKKYPAIRAECSDKIAAIKAVKDRLAAHMALHVQ